MFNPFPRFPIFILVLAFVGPLQAQAPDQIILLDKDTRQPIQGMAFVYGNQQGISDENGIIRFTYHPSASEPMRLSHINYGTWKWDTPALEKMIKAGSCTLEELAFSLYPATVIGVLHSNNASDEIDIDYQDHMEHDGAAILERVTFFNSIRKSGNYGFDPVFRGFKYDQLNIVLNGAQSATAACPNRMDPPTSQMAPNMIDRIEILKGPHALRYGTGFGGTVNFISPKLHFRQQPKPYGRFSSAYHSNGGILRTEGQIGINSRRIDASLFSAWSQGSDYRSGNGQTVQAGFQRGSFGTNLGIRLSGGQQLHVSVHYNLARDVDFAALPMDLRKDDTWLFNARHEMNLGSGKLRSWNTTIYGSFVNHLMDNLLKPLDPRTMNASTSARTYNYGGRTEGTWRLSNGELYTGADFRIEAAEGARLREFLMGPNAGNTVEDNVWQKSHISKTGVFAEYQIRTERFRYILSGRLEINHARIDDPATEFATVYEETGTTHLNPNASIGIVRPFGPGMKAGIWLGRAVQSGSLTERFINYFPVGQDPYEMLGNPLLEPEVNNQVDLTYEWTTDRSSLDVDLFVSYIQRYISSVIDTSLTPRLPSSPGVRRYVNTGQAFKTGFEVNWSRDLVFGLQSQMGIAYTYAQDLERNGPLPEVAPLDFRIALKGHYLKEKLIPEISFRHVSEQSRIAPSFGETVTPSFSLLDAKIACHLTGHIRFSAGGTNLLNKNYYEHLSRSVRGTDESIYAPGRCFFGSIHLSF